MRTIFALVALAGVALAASPHARADNRVFIIASQSDGYGIDECLASGAQCGVSAARSYCQAREFTEAAAFHRVDPLEITGSLPQGVPARCEGSACGSYIAITCSR